MKNIIDTLHEELGLSDSERQKKITLGKSDFREYCILRKPDFYKKERVYQEELCKTLQAAYEKRLINPNTGKPYKYLILNMPPGYGKSYTMGNFVTWCYIQNSKNKVITVSYNGNIAPEFSKMVREMIQDEAELGNEESYVVTSFNPDVKIKYGDGAVMKWSLEGSYTSYLATSFDGTLTGMRGNIIIVDDPIKNVEEAVNENIKEKHFNFFKNTLSSRALPGALFIIVQTRWATDDLAGKILEKFAEECFELKLAALTENSDRGISTCEDLYPTEDLQGKRGTLDETIWDANYMQVPVDKKGALYGVFKTYDAVDTDKFDRILNYTDTADEGDDFLCSISGGSIERYVYLLDVYYTDEGMERTEPETARRIQLHGVRESLIESNNGGRGFARNVISHLKRLRCFKSTVNWFFQSKRKKTRILTNATNVMEQVIMPEDWETRWPEFAKHIKKYQRKGKNDHDDAEDALTGIVEFVNGDVKGKKKAKVGKKSRLGV